MATSKKVAFAKTENTPVESVSVDDVVNILTHHGFGKCTQAVIDNDINGASLAVIESIDDLKPIATGLIPVKQKELYNLVKKLIKLGVPNSLVKPRESTIKSNPAPAPENSVSRASLATAGSDRQEEYLKNRCYQLELELKSCHDVLASQKRINAELELALQSAWDQNALPSGKKIKIN